MVKFDPISFTNIGIIIVFWQWSCIILGFRPILVHPNPQPPMEGSQPRRRVTNPEEEKCTLAWLAPGHTWPCQ